MKIIQPLVYAVLISIGIFIGNQVLLMQSLYVLFGIFIGRKFVLVIDKLLNTTAIFDGRNIYDKEEMKKKRMELMLKKLEKAGG